MKEVDSIKLGAVTVGQSPRQDMVPEMEAVLGPEFEVIQVGALDDYSRQQVKSELAPAPGDQVLVSRMRDGSQVVFAEKYIIPLLQEKINQLSTVGVEVILLLCTGKFPDFDSPVMIIEPRRVLHNLIAGLISDEPLGLVIPEAEQIEQARRWWQESGVELEIRPASPYGPAHSLRQTAREFQDSPVQVLFLDCMGFTREMQATVRRLTGKQVILPRTMVAAIIREMFV